MHWNLKGKDKTLFANDYTLMEWYTQDYSLWALFIVEKA
jgi:hypothetical protein